MPLWLWEAKSRSGDTDSLLRATLRMCRPMILWLFDLFQRLWLVALLVAALIMIGQGIRWGRG